MITAFQILVVVFSLFALSRAILRFKSREISFLAMMFWILIWAGVITLSFMPKIATFFAVIFGTRTADLLVFVGLIGSYYLIFRMYVAIEKQRQDITRVVREFAIEKEKQDRQEGYQVVK